MVEDYSLYFHIPFCKKKCGYCHFYVIPDQERHQLLWMEAVEKEWQKKRSLLPKNSPISIYFGGGTPSLIKPEFIEKILSWIPISKETEITLEANPENIASMPSFKNAGINRISLGAQTFDNELLVKIGRTHRSQETLHAVETIYNMGFQNISIDLMYDLPTQTLESWERTLDQTLQLPLSHVSLYNLSIEPHTSFYKRRKEIQKAMPNEKTSLEMLQMAISKLKNNHFERYEISAFAKDHKYSKHNIGYWTFRPFLGLGPSASSFWKGERFRNIANLNKYAKLEETIDFTEKLPPEESLKERLAIGLRLIKGIPLEPWPSLQSAISKLKQEGLIEQNEHNLCLTEKGLLFHDTVAEIIFSY